MRRLRLSTALSIHFKDTAAALQAEDPEGLQAVAAGVPPTAFSIDFKDTAAAPPAEGPEGLLAVAAVASSTALSIDLKDTETVLPAEDSEGLLAAVVVAPSTAFKDHTSMRRTTNAELKKIFALASLGRLRPTSIPFSRFARASTQEM